MNLADLTVTEIEQGWHETAEAYICNTCKAMFAKDQVFPEDTKFYPAATMIQRHLAANHPNAVTDLIQIDNKYNTLTTKQRDLLLAFAQGHKDAAVAEEMGVAAATVRHQKFTFREKAKQARLYLAIYDQVFNQPAPVDHLVTFPDQPGQKDDRFTMTTAEYDELVAKYFTSITPLTLTRWPRHQKAILAILKRVSESLPMTQHLSEMELTAKLKPIYADFPLLRRYLVDYGFLKRTASGSEYWRNFDNKELQMNRKEIIQNYKAAPTYYGVIQIKNNQNGKTFIDVARNIHNRWGYYQTNLNGNFYHDTALQADWNALGAEAFTYSVLWKADTADVDNLRQTLKELKAKWLDKCQPAYNQSERT
ncbi:DUF2087 domain-containing protein [Levilactobacillus huananensis]|uniref:DUF2087 domain-containing protein n=1 Tax=Levilactobacillus huananensis TaxID=2486019 RepID=UPI001CDC2675|nr:DUF2087 domain-containing protein [Levilactobacillus huananensis]